MKLSNKLTINSVLLLLISSTLVIISFLYNTERKRNNVSINKEPEINQTIDLDIFRLNIGSTNQSINPSLLLINKDNITVKLRDIHIPEKTIFFRFSEVNCNTCVDIEIDLISQTDSCDFIFLTSGNNVYGLTRTLLSREIHYPVYSIDFNALQLPIEDYSIPYYFTLDSQYLTSSIFSPDKKYPELTKDYFKSIKRRTNEK